MIDTVIANPLIVTLGGKRERKKGKGELGGEGKLLTRGAPSEGKSYQLSVKIQSCVVLSSERKIISSFVGFLFMNKMAVPACFIKTEYYKRSDL